jgi:hypothetical protein
MISNYITRALIRLLEEHTEPRDSMMLCVQYIHDIEMKLLNIPQSRYYEAVFDGKLSSFKTIDRTWRKIQEDIPSLRGVEWEVRQKLAGRWRNEMPQMSLMRDQLNLFDD